MMKRTAPDRRRRAGLGHHLLCGASLSALVMLALPSVARAQDQDRYWDANGTGTGSGGSGDWNTSVPVWSESNSDVLGPYRTWDNTALDNAIFGVTAGGTTTTVGTVNLTGPITVHNITFQRVNGWAIGGNTLTLGGTTPTINTVTNATINSIIAGTSGLTKTGAGQLYLTGANTFSGGITLSGGSLRLTNAAAMGGASNGITTTANASLQIDSGVSSGRTVTIGSGTTLTVSGAGTGSALYAGSGNISALSGVSLTNDANSYTGTTRLNGVTQGSGHVYFSSVRNLGEASSLGAPTTVANGTITFAGGSQYSDYIHYTGDGDTSNRNWVLQGGPTRVFVQQGTGTLTLTGDMSVTGTTFSAQTADLELLGVISGNGSVGFGASAAGSITLAGANTFTGTAGVSGGIVRASVLADSGTASSFGAGSTINLGHLGQLSYTGTGSSSNRAWGSDGTTAILNNGTGSLALGGNLAFTAGGTDTLTLGGSFAGTSNFSGAISGTGNLASSGGGIWVLDGVNTRTGTITMNGGTLRAGNASAFGTTNGVTVNSGTLDLNGFSLMTPTLGGTGGSIALGGNPLTTLTVEGTVNSSYGGSITGAGSLTKLGTSTLTLTGANNYAGPTNVGGGTLRLDFSPAGGSTSDIISSSSTLNMSGATLSLTGAAGEANTQTFNGLNIIGGANTIGGTSGSGGSLTVNFGAINRTAGIVNFNLPTSGNFTTTNTSLGGWATINGTDYAKVVGGNILAFTDADYADKDDAATWAAGEFISDSDGDAESYFGTVGSSIQLGGLQFTTPDATTTVTVAAGQTLGVDGTIIVAPSVLANNQTITGGNLAGLSGGGGVLGVLHNGTGTLTIESTVVDNGGATGFTKGGQGTVRLTGANSYTGATTLSAGRLIVDSIGSGGAASAVGASAAASSNLVLTGGTLQYAGGTATTDRGFTLINGGADTPTIQVDGSTNLTFAGQVTSPDDEGLTKRGTGTLTLASAANDYVGVTTIAGGTLAVGTLANGGLASGIGASGSASSNLVLEGGRLDYLGGTASTNRGFTLGAGNGRIGVADAGTTLTISGTGTGTTQLSKDGAGTLVLSGINSYGGGTVVAAGTLRAGSTQAFGLTDRQMTVDAGATLDLDNFNNRVGSVNGNGLVRLGSATLTSAGNNGTFGGAISGTGGFTKGGGGTQTFTGCNNSYTGVTTIQGLLIVDCLANGGVNSGIGASGSASSNLVFLGSMLRYTGGNVTTDRGFTLQSTGQIDVNNAATTLIFTGTVTGAGQLQKYGAGTLVLAGDNNNSGGVNVQAGILRAGSATAFGTGGYALANAAGAVLDLNGFNMSASALSGGGAAGGNIQLGSGTLTLTGGNASYSGLIAGTGGLVKTGGGTQILLGCDSNYTGGTTVSGGGLQVQCLTNGGLNSSIGASSNAASNLVVNNAAFTYVGAGNSTDRLMTIGGAAQILSSGTGAVDFTNMGAIVFANPNTAQTIQLGGTNASNNRFGLRIDNNGAGVTSFVKQDAGTWILTNPDSRYTGVTQILGGVLGVDKLSDGGVASSIGASSNAASSLIIGSGSTLRYTGSGDSTDRRFTLAVGTTFIESSGSGAVNFTNTGAVSYSGTGGRVMALGGTNAGDNIMGATIGNQNASNITSLAKNDSGKWILTGNNSFTGLTNINDGTLVVGNGGTAGSIVSSTINVAGSGFLGFNRSDTLTIGGAIQGAGAVQQLGTGTTILTGMSTYTGGTTIAQGTLQLGNGGPTGSILGDVVNNGTLTFNRNNAYTFAGTISSTGAVRQAGTGTTTLAGTNSYQGGTSIAAGTLQVSSDVNLGAASGGLTFNGGTLGTTASFASARATSLAGAGNVSTNAGTTFTLTGVISGPGALTKSGTGALVLTADNSYAGGTTIGAGTLQVGDGGATGSIAGNILNNGALVFNRAGTLTLGGTIIGGGSVTQSGPGTTVLAGNNSYAGPTTVAAGTLLVNGNQSGATNLTSVASGATLGGIGTIGGNVAIADGGTLAAGSNGVGVLTVNGDLSLGNASQLDFEFGQANMPGGPLNDLVNVGGDLVLGGVVNVTQTPGGSFGPGVYRMFNYSGALTNNGLTVGTMPGGSDVFVQTVIAGQVNLANAAGLTLNFWDGAGQPKNDSTIQGGDGTWVLGGGQNDWTEVNGTVNADYAQDSFAIFQGAGGTVTVDNGSGNVLTAGMQFTTDGYVIAGGPLTLTGTDALIRTGDGSPADPGISATIDAELTGSARLVKDLGGTLVLAGTNSYTGGTAVNGGTLQISSNANLGDNGGELSFNGGTLLTTADMGMIRNVDLVGTGTFDTGGNFLTLNGAVSGDGALVKAGAGVMALTSANSYTGGTTIAAGILQIGNGGTTGSIQGDVVDNGQLAFARSDDLVFAGTISGVGTLSQIGSGVLTLTADNSYTGTTSIGGFTPGTLRLGNGGTTGSIVGNVANGGTLIFNRSNDYSFAGLISGTGDVRQEGAGTTILTADNGYTGSTVISSGTLLINGNQTAANGPTNVLGGGTLGGTGTIGGDVLVGGSATLTPGDATGPGTLTINGNLGFSPNAVLAYDFGQANVVGGAFNDLVNVGGDLILAGTLNVVTSGGGSFDPGIYRIINYGGALTNNGLTIGSLPSGTDFYVQTSVAGQVNLINTNGLALRFWDGAAGGRNDGIITGGDGVWQNVSGNDNWTLDDASINAPFLDSAFAVFGGAGGTVSVDNGLGAVRASGMQFATDGYTVTGQDLTLVGPQSVIRVGDGSAAGAGYTATIESALTADGDLAKTDLGTLVLTGNGTVAGDVLANAGELRLAGGGALASVNGIVAVEAGDAAIMTVAGRDGSGNASTWTVGANLSVGYGGNGTLNVIDGGRVVSNTGQVGLDGNGLGQVLVSGMDSTWENSGRISVGLFGAGTLRIEAGATVASNDGIVGGSGQGDAIVSGLGTTWTNTQQLNVGSFGAGTMRIEKGASVTSNQGYIGANAAGSVTVTGAGSNWLVTAFDMTIGNVGSGSLTIADGGRVRAGSFSLGVATASSGTVSVLGTAGSRGVLETSRISAGVGAIDFSLDGGVLRATQDRSSFFAGFDAHDLALGAGGGVIDTNGHNIGISPRFVGPGGLTKDGLGTLTLTGASNYAGATLVNAGTLLVNGDQSGAPGLTSVASGASLGGTGTIGGDVTLVDGATLTPGAGGVGTLTVGGNLALSSGSVLDYAFGQTNVAGGALNDLVNVGGDLMLDGTINVTVPSTGSFGPGIYRVFNYGGTLTDNGLTLGTMPGSSDVTVQTAIAGQVNLVNTAGFTLSFWDGNAGPKNNGAVNGGDGVWRVGGGSNNWTDLDGSVNADYAQDSFAIFSAAPGTVTIDNSGGAVRASGMQFASDGYTITGDPLTLTGAQAIVQVGDGSATGAGYTATIAAELIGTAGLVKTDAGTLVLTGANGYTGGTAVNGGMLRISSDANLGDAVGGLSLDGGTLNTTADMGSNRAVDLAGAGTFLTDSGTVLTLGGTVSGTGALTKDGAGSLVLTADNGYTGGTTIAAGTLQLGNGGTSGSITGNVINNGALAFNRSDSLIFAGAISGGGEVSQIGSGATILAANNSYTGGTTISAGVLQLGNGGTTGGITGDVVNNAALAFNRSDAVTFAGLISGSGMLTQAGSGTTVLTGANSYTGATSVNAGTLLVNGDQSAAMSLTSVASGATLGGTGIIGGDVGVADGAALAPGAGGAGALTVNGNLSFAAGASLAYDFGLANAPGNPLNDVVHVGGDLTLDGTIDVAVTPGGVFDIGLYRVINYGGTLIDNGLAIGTMPPGSDVFVQTAVANQVNLINTGGATLNFWDGASGPKFDGAVNGGDGVWQNGTGNDNWTDATGAVNAPFDDGAFAIFTGAPGTVTIDNGLGAVTASGLQFAVDGYSIAGGDLTLTGPQSVIRVGDGTASGTGYTATIGSVITGANRLIKTDAGTLVLTGANSYTGGTAVNGGTLRIASDANLGAAAGGLSLNDGTLNTTADLSSARAVDLAGTGSFVTDTATTLSLTGAVSGAGGLTKSGAGALVLSGTGSHAGGTIVSAGTLLVNGNFAGATGPTNVASGASLGGTGTIGGDVILASGATLTPGAGGAGTLTIGGDLSLGAGTTLAWEFGAANVAGGALNDLVNVGGDLTLDGVLNVSVPASGAFDVGVYRVFNYGGALIDNGLGLGTMPAGSNVAVQTSIAGQVNLVNAAGLTLNFWDGAAGPKNNGVINGGNGIWQNSTGNDNWTDANGAVNAAYTDGAFAVFGGTGGTVTVDNGLGQVSTAGMQFAANGYTITGDGIALTGPQSTIRVGDGSTAGAGFTATINAALAGDAELVKTDAGTLVLTGTNSYTGGTLVSGGTVQISADANLGAPSGDVTLDGGTLATSANVTSARDIMMTGAGTIATAEGTTFSHGGLFSGTGALTKAGAGTLLVTGNSSGFTGATTVSAGTLAVMGSLGGAVGVDSSARLEGTGTVGNLTNSGVVAPGRDGFGTLTVSGSYTGSGGRLEIEAALGGDASQTDRLVVTNGTSGTTAISVTNRGGLGAQTVEGIKIVDVTSGSSAGTFALQGDYLFEGEQAVIAGAYGYRLYQGGVATPGDGDWYLRSALLDPQNEPQGPLYQPGVPLYESYAATLQTLNRLPTLQQRVGNRQWSGFTQGGVGMWGRMESTRHRPDAAFSTSGTDLDVDNWSLQAGLDKALVDDAEDTIIAGINGRYGTADARVRSRFGNGSIETSGYGVGATLTWYDSSGFYADAQAQASWYRGDLESDVLGTLVENNHGSGETFSLEVGKRAPLGSGLSVTPQIQMIYSHVRFDSFVDPNDAQVSSDRTGSLQTRWGISLDHQRSWDGSGGTRRSHLYGIVNLSHEWLDGSVVGVSGTPLARRDERLWGEVGLGGSYSWNNDRFTLFAEISADTAIDDFGDSNNLRGNAGFRVSF